jgi:hypothetical protein
MDNPRKPNSLKNYPFYQVKTIMQKAIPQGGTAKW